MVIKSGEGVVYLTRSQKFFQSSPTPRTHPDFSHLHPRGATPNYQKAQPIRPNTKNKMKKSELKT